jgi:hypothetical protein
MAIGEELVLDSHCCSVQYEYLWADGVKVKRPIKLTAPQYINTLFDWVEEQVCLLVMLSEDSPMQICVSHCAALAGG